MLTGEILEQVTRPGQYLGNEWGAVRKPFDTVDVHLALAFPDLYELGMSNFGLKILYQIVNRHPEFMADRTYAPGQDLEELLRFRQLPLWAFESRRPLSDFELVGFSLQYELTYTNVLNMLELAQIPVLQKDRKALFPLIFGGGPSSVNPEPMSSFMDFFLIGDGEEVIPKVMEAVRQFKTEFLAGSEEPTFLRQKLLLKLAREIEGVYVPSLYEVKSTDLPAVPAYEGLPERVNRQVVALSDDNQPTTSLVPYLNLVHDREVLEVRRGCDRGCRFCQPGYTFLPVRERSAEDLLRLSKQALANSGHQEYSMLSLCVSDYTSLHESVRTLNEEHAKRRSSLSFPSQRADRMNLDLAEELNVVRKSGITLAPEAGTERLRAVINKGLSHQQIITAIESAYQSGWSSIKLYFMCGLPTERDEDLQGIIDLLKEATNHCRVIRKTDPLKYRKQVEFTCTISNFVPKPFTPFQWFAQITPAETTRRHQVLSGYLKTSGLRNVKLNMTNPNISLLESVISRGDRSIGQIIYDAWRDGATFDAWDEKFHIERWQKAAQNHGTSLEALACCDREVGSKQPWDVVHIGLNDWWLVKEWEKAMAVLETPPCTENLCHACGVCTELDTTHLLAAPKPEALKRNPFVKELSANDKDQDHHPSLFFTKPDELPAQETLIRLRFEFTKLGELRFISHLDLQHLIARAARRAAIKIAYTQGFNPSPRLQLAAPLPLFQESRSEVGEIYLSESIEPEEFMVRINKQLPREVQLNKVKAAPLNAPSLASLFTTACYRATFTCRQNSNLDEQDLERKIESVLSMPSLMVEKNINAQNDSNESQLRDIKTGVISLSPSKASSNSLDFELSQGSKLHVKPSELLSFFDNDLLSWRVTRLELKAENGQPLFLV